jgi:predicted RNase H-like HicB family nuclease
MEITYSVQLWREGDQFIAHAMPVDVASSGPTPESARQAADEAVQAFLLTAAERGTLREVLEDAGYRKVRGAWRAPEWQGVEQRRALAEV